MSENYLIAILWIEVKYVLTGGGLLLVATMVGVAGFGLGGTTTSVDGGLGASTDSTVTAVTLTSGKFSDNSVAVGVEGFMMGNVIG